MCVGEIFNYCSLLHFNEVKYFSQDGRGLPNGIGFQRGNFIKECAENASSFVLSAHASSPVWLSVRSSESGQVKTHNR